MNNINPLRADDKTNHKEAQLHCVNNEEKLLLHDRVHQTSRGESAVTRLIDDQPWLLTSRGNNMILFSCDVKTQSTFSHGFDIAFCVSNSSFWKLIMFWIWRHHGDIMAMMLAEKFYSLLQLATSNAELILLVISPKQFLIVVSVWFWKFSMPHHGVALGSIIG